jgi:thioredoxin reductase (NADPH)
VLVLDTHAFGGQAGASARIENYLGFPTGISGQALAGRAYIPAQEFGAEMVVPVEVTSLDCTCFPYALKLDCGVRISAKTVVIATGAKYRRPDIPELEKYEGRGIYYWVSPIEAALCGQEEVILVGGGNAAGQAIVFLANYAASASPPPWAKAPRQSRRRIPDWHHRKLSIEHSLRPNCCSMSATY